MKTALSICLMIVLAGLAGCMYPNPPRIMMIDAALIQPAEMPFGWSFSWGVEDIQGCHMRYRMFEQSDDMPFIAHTVYDCPTVAAARAVFAAQQKPAVRARRVVMGEGQRPASADEYAAWCDTLGADPERFCETLARYDGQSCVADGGRVAEVDDRAQRREAGQGGQHSLNSHQQPSTAISSRSPERVGRLLMPGQNGDAQPR
jgi:hypothetical protein